jgi:cytochrome c2
MDKKITILAPIVGVILVILVIAACSPKSEPSSPPQPVQTGSPSTIDGAALLSQRCTVCHTLERVESKHKTQDEWKQTVDRMVGKGAVLNSEEENALVEYLTKTYGP